MNERSFVPSHSSVERFFLNPAGHERLDALSMQVKLPLVFKHLCDLWLQSSVPEIHSSISKNNSGIL